MHINRDNQLFSFTILSLPIFNIKVLVAINRCSNNFSCTINTTSPFLFNVLITRKLTKINIKAINGKGDFGMGTKIKSI